MARHNGIFTFGPIITSAMSSPPSTVQSAILIYKDVESDTDIDPARVV